MVTIRAAVGRKGPNNLDDVKKIEELLRKVQVAPPNGFTVQVPLKISNVTIKAIEDFQKLYGPSDGSVEPGKTTLRRLNAVAAPLQLNPIKLGLISKGGFLISFKGEKPPLPYRLFLGISLASPAIALGTKINPSSYLDVTARKQNDLMGSDNLASLLSIMKKQNLWGKKAVCVLCVARDGRLVSRSMAQLLNCPVQPLSGKLNPELGAGDLGPKLKYTGIQDGRMIHHVALNGDHFFKFAGKFETDNEKRGLNCITYVGAIYGVDSATGALSNYGTQLADELEAQQSEMENKKEADIKEFFKTHKAGTFIMWSSSHVVLVVDAILFEFSESQNGYVKTPVQDWNYHGKAYWIRKVTRSFGK